RPCEDRNFIRQEKLADEIKRNVELVVIPDEWKEKFFARIETWEAESSNDRRDQIDRLKTELTALKGKIDRINDGFTNGALDIKEFKELKNPLVPLKADLEQRIVALERDNGNRLEPLKNFVLEANQGI